MRDQNQRGAQLAVQVEHQLHHRGAGGKVQAAGGLVGQQHNRVLAEYALRGFEKPIGVSSFELTRALPATLQSSLPSIEDIEQELGGAAR